MISWVARSALYPPPDTPNGGLRAHISKGQFKSNSSEILHYALKDTIGTRKYIFGENIYFTYFRMGAILNFAYY